jgi:hypothetical protein
VKDEVRFNVTTRHGSWSWRCTRCSTTRRDQSFAAFASSMHAHQAERHSEFAFGQPITIAEGQ